MGARTKARKRALDVLFEADQRGDNLAQVLENRLAESGRQVPMPEYSEQIVRGIVARWIELNSIIEATSTEWTLHRMPAVDRAILRIGTWEILCNDEVSVGTAIDEAVTLAGDLSTDESPSFINGVLGAIAKDAPALGSGASETSEAPLE